MAEKVKADVQETQEVKPEKWLTLRQRIDVQPKETIVYPRSPLLNSTAEKKRFQIGDYKLVVPIGEPKEVPLSFAKHIRKVMKNEVIAARSFNKKAKRIPGSV